MHGRAFMSVLVVSAAALSAAVFAAGSEPGGAASESSSAAPAADPLSRAADAMPDWWKLGLEIRGRAETYQGLGGIPGAADSYYLSRLRLSSTFTVRQWFHLFAQMQDSRAPGFDRRPLPGNVADTFDLRQAIARSAISTSCGPTTRFENQRGRVQVRVAVLFPVAHD